MLKQWNFNDLCTVFQHPPLPAAADMMCQTPAQAVAAHKIHFCVALCLVIAYLIAGLTEKYLELIINCSPRWWKKIGSIIYTSKSTANHTT